MRDLTLGRSRARRTISPRTIARRTSREFGQGAADVMALADAVNEYVDRAEPWELAKDPARDAEVHDVCTRAHRRVFRMLTIYLAPILPSLAGSRRRGSSVSPADVGRTATTPASGTTPIQHLMARVDPKQVDALLDPTEPSPAPQRRPARSTGAAQPAAEPASPRPGHSTISIDDFARDRAARGADRRAEHVDGADKLLEAHARRRRRPRTVRCSPASSRLRPRRPHRAADRRGREPRAAQDEVRRLRRHGCSRPVRARAPASSCWRPMPARSQACASSDRCARQRSAVAAGHLARR